MAILKAQPTGASSLSWDLNGPWEDGSYPAILVDIIEREGVTKSYLDDNGETQSKEINTARFLFAYRNDDDEIVLAQTYEYNQTASMKGHLIKMLSSIRGKVPPLDGSYDYCTEIGRKCQITIEVKTGKQSKQEYGAIVGFSAIPKKLIGDCPELDEVELPGDRRTEIPEGVEPAKSTKAKAKAKKVEVEDDEEDPF